MRFTLGQSTLKEALRQRDLSAWACLGLVAVNCLLVIKVFGSEERWVLIPQYDVDHRVEISSQKYSDDYFIDWANGVVGTILCVNPDSVDWKNQQILKITVQSYGTLKEKLKEDALRIKKDHISTVFYPKKFTVHRGRQTVDVIGEQITYFGKDSSPVTSEKTYQLTWDVRAHGIILLKDFNEIKREEKHA